MLRLGVDYAESVGANRRPRGGGVEPEFEHIAAPVFFHEVRRSEPGDAGLQRSYRRSPSSPVMGADGQVAFNIIRCGT